MLQLQRRDRHSFGHGYTPNLLYLGTDQFSFRIASVLTFTATGPVKINVLP